MKEFEAINVVVESQPDKQINETHTESGGYEITAVNKNGKVKEFSAGALNLNGFAFATPSMEIGEYDETIVVEQEDGSRYINLKVQKSEAK